MSTPVILVDPSSKIEACITKYRQIVTAPVDYDDTVFKELAEDNTAYNFYGPFAGKRFVITGMILKSDKQVSTSADATVVVYEADAADTTTVDKTLLQLAMVEGDLLVLLPLNLIISEGKFVNAKTTDDDIHVTIMGYYVTE